MPLAVGVMLTAAQARAQEAAEVAPPPAETPAVAAEAAPAPIAPAPIAPAPIAPAPAAERPLGARLPEGLSAGERDAAKQARLAELKNLEKANLDLVAGEQLYQAQLDAWREEVRDAESSQRFKMWWGTIGGTLLIGAGIHMVVADDPILVSSDDKEKVAVINFVAGGLALALGVHAAFTIPDADAIIAKQQQAQKDGFPLVRF